MSRLSTVFKAKRRALIPFVTAGDPQLANVPELMKALVKGGADVIELGFPFSDPMADGPVIQRSSERAMNHGVHLAKVLDWAAEFRLTDSQTGVVLMGYLNPVLRMGVQAFAQQCQQSGVDGVLIVDLPPAEANSLQAALRKHEVDLIFLVAPTTTNERLVQIAQVASGYVYYVSLTGITGANLGGTVDVVERVEHLRKFLKLPIAVGFGIKDAATAQAIGRVADGVVIGSALVNLLDQVANPANANDTTTSAQVYQAAEQFLAPIRLALNS